MKKLALDNSSAVFLAKIGLLIKLSKFLQLITTVGIAEETNKGVEIGYRDAFIRQEMIKDGKIKIIKPNNADKIKKDYKLKEADAGIIALAFENDCLLATEDNVLQNTAKLLNIKITNTAALLYTFYTKGEISKDQCITIMDLLEHYGYNKEITLKMKEKLIRGDKK